MRMAKPTEGIGAATGSRRGAFSPQNVREGRAQGDTSGKHTGMRKRAGTTILDADEEPSRHRMPEKEGRMETQAGSIRA